MYQGRQKQNLCSDAHVRYNIGSHAPNKFCACAMCFGMLHIDPYSQKRVQRLHTSRTQTSVC